MDKFKLIWGFDTIVEGTEYFDTAEQAYDRINFLGSAISCGFAADAVNGVREHGRYELGGEWFELRNGREAC